MRSRFYSGRVRQAIRKTGLNRLLSKPYWQLVYALSEKTQTHEIANRSIDFRTDTFSEFMRFRDLAGERSVVKDLLKNLDSDDIFYDIGANVGTYTCFAAAELGPGRTVAFEPEPENVDALQKNLEINGLGAEIVQVALSNTNGTVDLALTGNEAGEGEHSIVTDDNGQTIEVETIRGDLVIKKRGLPKPTVIKIDVEGAELEVLRGLSSTIQESCRYIYCEIHDDKLDGFDQTRSDVESLLTDLGFQIRRIDERGDEYFLLGEKSV